jgi:hypothetical protein
MEGLYDNLNLGTIPDCILDELRKYSNNFSSHSVRGIDGKFKTTYGKKILPIFMKFNYDYLNFYLSPNHFEDIRSCFKMTTILSENGVVLEYNKLYDYYKSYSDGFEKGYYECESLFQVGNSLFKKTDEAIAFDIYSRVVSNKNKGGLSFYAPFQLDEVQRFSWVKNELRFMPRKKRLNFPYFISLKGCFNNGYNGGVFYKCWLIILNNPLLFESFFFENEKKNQFKQSETPQQSKQEYTPKPCFKPESIESITDILNVFFDTSQHSELKRIIETGTNTNEKLLFRDNGNKLTDCFKKLYENNTITGCAKTVLINWIIENFKFTYRNSIKDYDPKTVEKIISSKERLCKNPII